MLCFLPAFQVRSYSCIKAQMRNIRNLRKTLGFLACIVAVILYCLNYLKTLWLKTCISWQFLWVRIWKWFCWIVLTYTISWGYKQNVSRDCSHLKAWLGWKIHIQAHSCGLAGGLRSLLVVGWKPQFLTSRACLFSPHGCNLPRENDLRDRIGNHNVFHNLDLEVP